MLLDNCKFGFSHGSWWCIKDLKEKEVFFTSKGNYGVVSHLLKVQRDQKGGTTNKISLTRRSKECMQA